MNQQPDPFLRFVKANLEQPCPVFVSRNIVMADNYGNPVGQPLDGSHSSMCLCHGTGRVPLPEAVELRGLLLVMDDISGVVVPRSDAEQHMAAENWAHKQGYTITWDAKYDYGWEFWREEYGGHALEFFTGLQAALVANGWTDVAVVSEQAQRTWQARQPEIDQLRAQLAGKSTALMAESEVFIYKVAELQTERDQLRAQVARLREALTQAQPWIGVEKRSMSTDENPLESGPTAASFAVYAALTETGSKP